VQPDNQDSDRLRREMIRLLRAQMQALETPGLSDMELTACYRRQERVDELRDRLTQASPMTESAP
jgi:hypothetical protein